MKITILGAGTGASDYLTGKTTNRWPPAFLIEWGKDEKLMFECSQAIQQRLEQTGHDYAGIHHIAISHPHPDHCAPIHFIQSVYIKGLFGGEKFTNHKLSIYAPDYLIENFRELWNIHIPNEKDKYFEFPELTLVPMSNSISSITIGTGVLSARKVYHGFGKCDAVSYRLETPDVRVAYSGDTGDCDGVREMAKDADIFICESEAMIGDFTTPKEYGHLNPYTAGEIARNAGVKKLILFHYRELDSDEAMQDEVKRSGFTGEVVLGKDFQEISF